MKDSSSVVQSCTKLKPKKAKRNETKKKKRNIFGAVVDTILCIVKRMPILYTPYAIVCVSSVHLIGRNAKNEKKIRKEVEEITYSTLYILKVHGARHIRQYNAILLMDSQFNHSPFANDHFVIHLFFILVSMERVAFKYRYDIEVFIDVVIG